MRRDPVFHRVRMYTERKNAVKLQTLARSWLAHRKWHKLIEEAKKHSHSLLCRKEVQSWHHTAAASATAPLTSPLLWLLTPNVLAVTGASIAATPTLSSHLLPLLPNAQVILEIEDLHASLKADSKKLGQFYVAHPDLHSWGAVRPTDDGDANVGSHPPVSAHEVNLTMLTKIFDIDLTEPMSMCVRACVRASESGLG